MPRRISERYRGFVSLIDHGKLAEAVVLVLGETGAAAVKTCGIVVEAVVVGVAKAAVEVFPRPGPGLSLYVLRFSYNLLLRMPHQSSKWPEVDHGKLAEAVKSEKHGSVTEVIVSTIVTAAAQVALDVALDAAFSRLARGLSTVALSEVGQRALAIAREVGQRALAIANEVGGMAIEVGNEVGQRAVQVIAFGNEFGQSAIDVVRGCIGKMYHSFFG